MPNSVLVSIIVNNYNYDQFLRTAVNSALEQSYSPLEVIVVDDFSTDDSRQIIEQYGDHIIPISHETNGKQGAAFNSGYAKSKGDIIIFLDADDYLYPDAVEKIVGAWQPNTAKVHYRLAVVDSNSDPKGFSLPQGEDSLDTSLARQKILSEGACNSVPTSGNALSRKAMEHIFPIPIEFNTTSDDYLSVLIPLYGEVIAIEEALGAYRIHDSNQWALVELDDSRFRRFIAHDLQRCTLIKARGRALGYTVPEDLETRAVGSVWSRLVSLRLDPKQHPIPTDRRLPLVFLGLKALWQHSSHSLKKRVLFSLWFIWVGLMPLSLAKPPIRWLFMPNQRPQLLRSIKNALFKVPGGSSMDEAHSETVPSRSERLRVLFVSHAYVVGVNQGKLAAIARYAKVGLLAPQNWYSKGWSRPLPLEKPYPDVQTYPGNILFSGRGGAYLYNPFRIWQVIHQFKPDIIQVEVEVFSLCALQLAIVSRLTKIPLAIFSWENMERHLFLRQWIRDFVLNTAPLVIAGNRDGKQVLKQWNYSGTIEVMPQIGVDEKLFRPEIAQPNKSEINIGFLGRVVPEKGIDLLLEAAARLKQQDLHFHLTICGSGQSLSELQQSVEQLDITERVSWRDAVRHDQVPQELGQFDVLVLPSRTVDTWKEQFGHVLIEAMAIGIPTVGSTCGEIPNVIHHTELIFEEGNVDGLADILAKLISDEPFRQAMGQYCLERAHQYYTHDRIAQRSVALWEEVLGSSTTGLPNAEPLLNAARPVPSEL